MIVCEIVIDIPFEIARGNSISVHRYFYTVIDNPAHVLGQRSKAGSRVYRVFCQQVGTVLGVVIKAEVQPAVEEREIQPDVGRFGLFPS